MPKPPITRDAITAALKECGPMSVPEIAEHLGMARNRINTCMTTARKNHPGRYFRIVRYRPQVGVSGREPRSTRPAQALMLPAPSST